MHENDTYQWRLRALGAFLDTQRASFISLIETKTGFAVRYYQRASERDPIFVHVEAAQLRAIAEALRGRRGTDALPAMAPSIEGVKDDRYQDFFRALGWELDDLRAANITLDEQEEEGVFVAYAFRDPETGKDWRKRVAHLGAVEKQQIMSEALHRRRS